MWAWGFLIYLSWKKYGLSARATRVVGLWRTIFFRTRTRRAGLNRPTTIRGHYSDGYYPWLRERSGWKTEQKRKIENLAPSRRKRILATYPRSIQTRKRRPRFQPTSLTRLSLYHLVLVHALFFLISFFLPCFFSFRDCFALLPPIKLPFPWKGRLSQPWAFLNDTDVQRGLDQTFF